MEAHERTNFKKSYLITRQLGCWLYGTDNQILSYMELFKITKNSYKPVHIFRTSVKLIQTSLYIEGT